jgi:hypothetical protein
MVVVTKRETGEHPVGKRLVRSLARGLERPEGRAFAASFARTMRDINLTTPAGLYLGNVGGFTPDWKRLERFAQRIVRGLYWKEMGRALAINHFLRATPIIQATPDLLKSVKELYGDREPRHIGAGAFSYVFTPTPKGGGTAWIIEFYENVAFFALTGDPNHPDMQDFLAVESTSDLARP